MVTVTYEAEYSTSVTPKKTKHLSSAPLSIKFKYTFEMEKSDSANEKKIKDEFGKEMKKRIEGQLSHLNTWLSEKSQLVADANAAYEKAQKALSSHTFAKSEAEKMRQNVLDVARMGKEIDELVSEYQQIASDWAENCAQQQGLIALQLATKKARVATYNAKKTRIRLGAVLKATLIVVGVAAGIAALVLSAGTLAPLALGLGIAGVALTGISGGAAGYKIYKGAKDAEVKLMKNVQSDIKELESVLKSANTSKGKMGSHLTELRNLMRMREDAIKKIGMDIRKNAVTTESYLKANAALESAAPRDMDTSAIKKNKAKAEKLEKDLQKLISDLEKFSKSLDEAKKLEASLDDLCVKLDDVAGIAPNTVTGNVGAFLRTSDGWIQIIGGLGMVAGGASAITA